MSKNDKRTVMRISHRRSANFFSRYHLNLLTKTNQFKRTFTVSIYSKISNGNLPNFIQLLQGFYLAITIMFIKVINHIRR